MNDRAYSPVLGSLLCVAITVTMFAALCIPILSWCWTFDCETHADTFHGGSPWTYCHGHQFQTPACDSGAPVFKDTPQGTMWCHTIDVKELVHDRHGVSMETVQEIVCTLVSTLENATQ